MKKSMLAAILIAVHFAILIYTAAAITNNNANTQSMQVFDIENTVWVTRINNEDEDKDTIMILHFKDNGIAGLRLLREGDAFIEFINEYDFDKENQTGIVYYPARAYVMQLFDEFGEEAVSNDRARPFGTLKVIGDRLQYNDKILERTSLNISEMMCYLFTALNRIE